ncbi:MAG TPA: methyltransferase domain-containing protein [Mycobacteriales bacterium]|nr:methyltransferase domain-containing protein [Mycobacteriales bacterium]
MATRSVRWRGFQLQLTVPTRTGRSAEEQRAGAAPGAPGRLLFRDPPPQPHVRRRDVAAVTSFVDTAHEKLAEHRRAQTTRADLAQRLTEVDWYHTIELPGGVVTPGQFDHRSLLPRYGLPADLSGQRTLDVATFDGFWAFEMEKRGADVVAIDVETRADYDYPTPARSRLEDVRDLPPVGTGFALAHEAIGSTVERVAASVYALDPALHGTFDLVHCGDLLLHLRDPLTALERMRAVTRGQLLLSDVVDLEIGEGPWGPTTQYLGGWSDVVWWVPSLSALAQMVVDAGFRDVRVNAVYSLAKTYETTGLWRASISASA